MARRSRPRSGTPAAVRARPRRARRRSSHRAPLGGVEPTEPDARDPRPDVSRRVRMRAHVDRQRWVVAQQPPGDIVGRRDHALGVRAEPTREDRAPAGDVAAIARAAARGTHRNRPRRARRRRPRRDPGDSAADQSVVQRDVVADAEVRRQIEDLARQPVDVVVVEPRDAERGEQRGQGLRDRPGEHEMAIERDRAPRPAQTHDARRRGLHAQDLGAIGERGRELVAT